MQELLCVGEEEESEREAGLGIESIAHEVERKANGCMMDQERGAWINSSRGDLSRLWSVWYCIAVYHTIPFYIQVSLLGR